MKVTFTIDMQDKQFDKWLDDYKGDKATDLSSILQGRKGYINSWSKEIKQIPVNARIGIIKEVFGHGEISVIVLEDETKST